MKDDNARRIGILQKVYAFCDKYEMSHDKADPFFIMQNGLMKLVMKNKLDEMIKGEICPNEEPVHYVDTSVYFLGEYVVSGPFTPKQLEDLAEIGSAVSFKK